MAAGIHYDLTPAIENEELYNIKTGVRKTGPWKLDTANLVEGSILPVFTPVQADMATHKIVPVRNMKVVEDYTTGDSALTIKVDKKNLAYAGMFIGNGSKGSKVTAIDRSNASYDTLTIATAFGADLKVGNIIYESTAAGGTVKKQTANFVLYGRKKVETNDPVLPTLLMQAYEVKESKLPFFLTEADKTGLTSRFQFD